MIILGLILLGPFVVIAAVLGARFLEWQRLLPAGLPRFTPLCLIAFGLLGSLLAGDTLKAFVASPIRLQRHFAGAVYVSPLALQSVERSGFRIRARPGPIRWTTRRCVRFGRVARCSAPSPVSRNIATWAPTSTSDIMPEWAYPDGRRWS